MKIHLEILFIHRIIFFYLHLKKWKASYYLDKIPTFIFNNIAALRQKGTRIPIHSLLDLVSIWIKFGGGFAYRLCLIFLSGV